MSKGESQTILRIPLVSSEQIVLFPEPEGKITARSAASANKLRANFFAGILSHGVTLRSIDFADDLSLLATDRALTLPRQIRGYPNKRRRLIALLFRRLALRHRALWSSDWCTLSIGYLERSLSEFAQPNFPFHISISAMSRSRCRTTHRVYVGKIIRLLFPSRIRARLNQVMTLAIINY